MLKPERIQLRFWKDRFFRELFRQVAEAIVLAVLRAIRGRREVGVDDEAKPRSRAAK